MIHLEGMGVQGCLLAHHLDRRGVCFTWNDIEAPHTAWRASTGAIYPSGSERFGPDHSCWLAWGQWWRQGVFGPGFLERATFWFCTGSPPHEGRYGIVQREGSLKRGDAYSYHFNAQTFVEATRQRFKKARQEVAPKKCRRIVTHGWSARQSHTYWGWTAPVVLAYDSSAFGTTERPCFYFRQGRFVMAYAYPIPGTNRWYAGSSIIKQKASHELEVKPKYERWQREFERLGDGRVRVKDVGPFIQGWRPAVADTDVAWWRQESDGTLVARPLWNNGIRHFPHTLALLWSLL